MASRTPEEIHTLFKKQSELEMLRVVRYIEELRLLGALEFYIVDLVPFWRREEAERWDKRQILAVLRKHLSSLEALGCLVKRFQPSCAGGIARNYYSCTETWLSLSALRGRF